MLVHAVGLEGKINVHHAQHHISRGIKRFDKLHIVVVHVAQIDGRFAFENGKIAAYGQLVKHIAQWQKRSAQADGIALEAVNLTENIAVFIFKQGLVYGFKTIVVRLQNDEIVVHNAVKQAIRQKRCVFVQNVVRIFVHLPAQLAEQAQRFLLERQHKIFADNHIHLVGMELACGGIVVYLCGSKYIVAVVFDFRTLLAAENIFNNQLMDAVRLKRVFE